MGNQPSYMIAVGLVSPFEDIYGGKKKPFFFFFLLNNGN